MHDFSRTGIDAALVSGYLTNMTNTDDNSTTILNEAQLYWDDQDPKNAGWVLRWRDERGQTESVEVGEDADASIETLAHQAADCTPDRATGDIAVYRGDVKRGRITLIDGIITNWRAL